MLLTTSLSFGESFSVSTQNLWHYTSGYKERLQSLQDNLEYEKADIMGFQEAWKSFSGKSLFKHYVDDTNLDVFYYKTNNTVIIREGLAIATNLKMVGKRLGYKLPYSKKLFGKRVMLVSTIKLSENLDIYVINVHFSPFGDRKHERVAQLEFVINKIKNKFYDKPVIILGDFNQEEDFEFFKPLMNLGFSPSATKKEIGCTFCEVNEYTDAPFNSKLDYIFYQKEFFKVDEVRKTFVENPISDHYGIRVEFSTY